MFRVFNLIIRFFNNFFEEKKYHSKKKKKGNFEIRSMPYSKNAALNEENFQQGSVKQNIPQNTGFNKKTTGVVLPSRSDGVSLSQKFAKNVNAGVIKKPIEPKKQDIISKKKKDSIVDIKSKGINNESFKNRVDTSNADLVYLVRGKDGDRPAWHYVLVDRAKLSVFLHKTNGGSINVAQYGTVLASGWGIDPPKNTVDDINKKFGINKSNDDKNNETEDKNDDNS